MGLKWLNFTYLLTSKVASSFNLAFIYYLFIYLLIHPHILFENQSISQHCSLGFLLEVQQGPLRRTLDLQSHLSHRWWGHRRKNRTLGWEAPLTKEVSGGEGQDSVQNMQGCGFRPGLGFLGDRRVVWDLHLASLGRDPGRSGPTPSPGITAVHLALSLCCVLQLAACGRSVGNGGTQNRGSRKTWFALGRNLKWMGLPWRSQVPLAPEPVIHFLPHTPPPTVPKQIALGTYNSEVIMVPVEFWAFPLSSCVPRQMSWTFLII